MELFISAILCMVVAQISDVEAAINDGDVIGMAVAGCAAFVILSAVIAMIVVSLQWRDWFNNWMRPKNKVRMPKSYFKKKEEAKKRLVASSMASHKSERKREQPGQSVLDTATWVEDWRRRARYLPPRRLYEEKDVTVELGDELDDDEEFTIETEVLEGEPFSHEHTKNNSAPGDLYRMSNTYNTVENLYETEQAPADNAAEVAAEVAAVITTPSADDKKQAESEGSSTSSEEERITNF